MYLLWHSEKAWNFLSPLYFSLSIQLLVLSQQHFCTEYCSSHPPWARQENLVGSILDVFVNHKSGQYHICTGKHCGAKHVFSAEGGLSTCTISGLQFSEQVYINSFKLNHEYHRTSSSIVRVETALLRDTSKGLIKTFLFSDIRRRAEQKKLFEARKEVHKIRLIKICGDDKRLTATKTDLPSSIRSSCSPCSSSATRVLIP